MGLGRISVVLLGAASLLPACRTPDPMDEFDRPRDEYGYRDTRPRREEPYETGPSRDLERTEPVEDGVRFLLGAWGFDGRVRGRAEGAPVDFGEHSSSSPGFSVEARYLSRGDDPESWYTGGVLLEHFHGAESRSVPSGRFRTEGALTGIFATLGAAWDPYRDGNALPAEFGSRFDVLFGVRRGFSKVEVPDGAGGTFRKSSTWPEIAGGVRGEWSPIHRVAIFARFDGGAELTPDDLSDEEDGGDSSLGAVSYNFMAGVRIRPVDHLSLLAGWRFLRLEGKEILSNGTDEVQTARTTWSGPWAGIELDF